MADIDIILDRLKSIEDKLMSIPAITSSVAPEIIDTKELCIRLNISEPTVMKWRLKNKIPFIKVGSTIRYNWPSVVSHIGQSERRATQRLVLPDYKEISINDKCDCCGKEDPICGSYGIDSPIANLICLDCQEMLKSNYIEKSGNKKYSLGELLQRHKAKVGIQEISDQYVINRITTRSKSTLKKGDISPDLIELARQNIRLKREIKHLNNANTKKKS